MNEKILIYWMGYIIGFSTMLLGVMIGEILK